MRQVLHGVRGQFEEERAVDQCGLGDAAPELLGQFRDRDVLVTEGGEQVALLGLDSADHLGQQAFARAEVIAQHPVAGADAGRDRCADWRRRCRSWRSARRHPEAVTRGSLRCSLTFFRLSHLERDVLLGQLGEQSAEQPAERPFLDDRRGRDGALGGLGDPVTAGGLDAGGAGYPVRSTRPRPVRSPPRRRPGASVGGSGSGLRGGSAPRRAARSRRWSASTRATWRRR